MLVWRAENWWSNGTWFSYGLTHCISHVTLVPVSNVGVGGGCTLGFVIGFYIAELLFGNSLRIMIVGSTFYPPVARISVGKAPNPS
jgi:hypothetical protein